MRHYLLFIEVSISSNTIFSVVPVPTAIRLETIMYHAVTRQIALLARPKNPSQKSLLDAAQIKISTCIFLRVVSIFNQITSFYGPLSASVSPAHHVSVEVRKAYLRLMSSYMRELAHGGLIIKLSPNL